MIRSSFVIAAITLSITCAAQLTWVPCTMPVNTLTHLDLGPSGELYTFTTTNPIQIKVSTDQGLTWQTRPGTGGPNGMLLFDQRFFVTPAGSILFWGNTGIGTFLWRSDDGGNSFTQLVAPQGVPSGRFFLGFGSSPAGDVYLYGQGVMHSDDDGLTWTSIASTSTGIDALAANTQSVFALRFGTVYQGALDGTGFAGTNTSGALVTDGRAITDGLNDRMVAVGGTDKVITTTDNGNLWAAANTGLGSVPTEYDRVAASPLADRWVIAKQIGVRYTDDAGSSWSVAETGLSLAPNEPIQGVFCDPTGVFYLFGYSHLYRSDISTGVIEEVEGSTPIWPNPTTGSVNLPLSFAGTQVEVCDLAGKVVGTHTASPQGAIDLAGLRPGRYIVRSLDGRLREAVELHP
ncbi:MAG: T9SS type A sorting domain-containing protein [Flavobacteriales bacterium]|nr:T9SS type A sorting domain-containing protein [Flavobacteriales bacterium]MCB0810775.1 T9SS type A sorting domain-containing protein [Flavobacteriales bacterium]